MSVKRVKFTFPTNLVTEPIIYSISKNFEVITNIRRADVRPEMGWVILDLEGPEEEINKCLEWTKTSGVTVDDLNDDTNNDSLVEG
ncbi:MAG: NIL domain-containing protein [Dehalococcoidia bacterium]|tara:strand:- start:15 stop:272 length:258 start_codon:yes stop_codon:yes gene_type:complete